jgi:hypothetical protein
VDQLHAAPVRLGALAGGFDRQRALEVVDDGQQVEQEALGGRSAISRRSRSTRLRKLSNSAVVRKQAVAQLLALVDGLGQVVSSGGVSPASGGLGSASRRGRGRSRRSSWSRWVSKTSQARLRLGPDGAAGTSRRSVAVEASVTALAALSTRLMARE